MQETQETSIQSPGWEDPLEEGMAIHSGIFAWNIPWTEKPGGLQSIGSQQVPHDWAYTHTHTHTHTHTQAQSINFGVFFNQNHHKNEVRVNFKKKE